MKSLLKAKEQEKDYYLKIIWSCLAHFKNEIRMVDINVDNNIIRLMVEILQKKKTELIHVKNVKFFSFEEITQILTDKFNSIIKKS